MVDARGAGRRRLTLHVRAGENRARAGLMAARSHDLVEIAHCPITVPMLHRAPAVAGALSAPLGHGRKPLDVAFTATEAGLDVDIRGHGPASEGVRAVLVRLASDLDLARLSLHGDVLVERRAPAVTSSGLRLVPPAGGFLQATEAGEAVLTGAVVAALDRRTKRVADLFSGAGPFTLALARTCDVHAVEGEAAALASLDRAVRAVPGLRRVTTERRDLFRRPLLTLELDAYDAVVFDPPGPGRGRRPPGSPNPMSRSSSAWPAMSAPSPAMPRPWWPGATPWSGSPRRSVRLFGPCGGGRRVPAATPAAQAPVTCRRAGACRLSAAPAS